MIVKIAAEFSWATMGQIGLSNSSRSNFKVFILNGFDFLTNFFLRVLRVHTGRRIFPHRFTDPFSKRLQW